jgi:hypothetical protein
MWATSFEQEGMRGSIKLFEPLQFVVMCLDSARKVGVMYICVRRTVPTD